MNTISVTLTLDELRDALCQYVKTHTGSTPKFICVKSYNRYMLIVETEPKGLVETVELKHRTST